MEILSVKDLTFTYPGTDKPVIKNVSFDIREGEMIVVCGRTGSGKSTLLRMIKEELRPHGEFSGSIEFSDPSVKTGFVMQNPNEQAVTDKVWHELVFGMENYGLKQDVMALRSAEMSAYFGIEELYEKNVNELSGGQLQMLNLASVMACDPEILILDEPTAQLDPVAASMFLSAIEKLNKDFALTVIIAEHRLDDLLPMCDRMIVLDDGAVAVEGKVADVIAGAAACPGLFEALPAPYRLSRMLGENSDCPLTIREGREFIRGYIKNGNADTGSNKGVLHKSGTNTDDEKNNKDRIEKSADENKRGDETNQNDRKNPALEMKEVFFRYDRYSPDALKGFELTVNKGEIFCLLGGNGSGKTTALNVAAGLLKPYSGSVRVFSTKIKDYKNQGLYNKCLAMMPQDVQTLFLYDSVQKEIDSMGGFDLLPSNVAEWIRPFADKHPYDLSGGEQQMVAFAKTLAAQPKIFLMDEPTRGMDAECKIRFARVIKELKKEGITFLIVTHDVEFAAVCADRCGLCFNGKIAALTGTEEFFADNRLYTTAACRMSRGICGGAATIEGLAAVLDTGGRRFDSF
ncbi:MAG: ATP-binding cassette domain-containing protein [Lachnospiraceae bacterium]|nr:ATP-binding cassette domain-containing protein [Lachnospiraceae bacterium]